MRAIFGLTALDAGAVRWDGAPIDRRGAPPLRLPPRGARALPDDADRRPAELPRSAARAEQGDGERTGASWLQRLDLGDRARSNLEELSLGNQQRVQLISALRARARRAGARRAVLRARPGRRRRAVRRCSSREARRGATVLFSSHQLDLVEDLCEDAVIVDRGRVVAHGPLDDLTAGHDPVLEIDVPERRHRLVDRSPRPGALQRVQHRQRFGAPERGRRGDGRRRRLDAHRAGPAGARCGARRRRGEPLRVRAAHASPRCSSTSSAARSRSTRPRPSATPRRRPLTPTSPRCRREVRRQRHHAGRQARDHRGAAGQGGARSPSPSRPSP